MPLNLDAFKSSLIYQTADTVNSIRLDVAELRKLDKYKESKQAKWTWLGCMGLLAVFITGIGSIFLPLLLPLLAVAGVVTVVSFVIRSIHKRLNYENRRYELLDKVLGLIGKDAAKDEKLDVRLDLRPAEHKDKFVRQGQVGVWKVKYYEDPWLELEGRLLDGTRFRLTMIEKCQARSCWKRGRSGKSKYKSKKKSAAESALLLRFKPGRYAAMERIGSELAGAVQLPPAWI
ncbi:MAG: hypothetical protein M5U26_26105 [Planctomycetota bacterium]|nr:hypothetical protein [Planctomycetota bacterium]